MKKLLIAIAAAATAIGTYAATAIGGAGFDTGDTAEKYTWDKDGGFNANFWSGTAGTTTLTLGDCGFLDDARPAGYAVSKTDFMAVKTTFGQPITQNILENGSGQLIGDGFYYDGLVKFTACDETPDLTVANYEGAKIGFFPLLESDDDNAKAYLYIWANGGTNLWKTTTEIDDQWHRVTIKMIANANRTGDAQAAFVVFIDGNAVNCVDAKAAFTEANLTPAAKKWWTNGQLFASLDADGTEVTGVLYDGQGAIDEVGFTDEAPDFAADAQFFSVTFGDTIAKLYLVGPDGTIEPASGDDIELKSGSWYYYYDAAGERVSIKAIDAVPFTPTKDTAFPIPAAVEALATVTVGESVEYYADAASAFEAAQDAEADAIVTLKAEVTQVDALVVDSDYVTTLDLAGFAVDAPITVNTEFVITNSSDAVAEDGLLAGRTLQEIGLVAGNVSIYNSFIAVDSEGTQDDYYEDYAALIYSGQVGFEISDFKTASSYINYADGLKAEAIPDTAAWQIVPAEVATAKVLLTATHATALMNDGAIESGADVEVGTTIFVTAEAEANYDTPVITVNGKDYDDAHGYTIQDTDTEVTFEVTASATVWNITYIDNGEPVEGTYTYTIENRETTELLVPAEKAGFTFDGWYIGDDKVTSLADKTGALTLTAKWTEVITDYVAIGDDKYATMAEAFAAAKDGDTITFLHDFEGEFYTGNYETVSNFVNGLTIDLNGKTWTLTGPGTKKDKNNKDEAVHERLWEDRKGNSFLIKNGSLKAVQDSTWKQKIAFYTYAETLEFNDVALDFSELAMGATADPADPRTDVPIVSQNGNVKFTGTTTVKLATNQRLVTILDRANAEYVPGTLTLDVGGELPGDILLYSACKIVVGTGTTLNGKVYTGAAAWSGFEPAGALGSPFKAMVGAILPATGSASINTRGGQLYTSIEDAQTAIATTTFAKNLIVLQNASKDSFAVAEGAENFEIPADVTFTATTSFALNGAKVKLALGGELVVPAELTIATDFVAPAAGTKIKVAGEGPYTYTCEFDAPIPLPAEDTPQAVAAALAAKDITAADVTTKADLEALNAMLKAAGVTDAATLSAGAKANLNSSFLMKDIAAGKIFEEAASITIEKIEATETAGTFEFTVAVKEGATLVELQQAGAAALADKVLVGNKVDAISSKVEAEALTVKDVADGKAVFDIAYGDGEAGFMKINVTK